MALKQVVEGVYLLSLGFVNAYLLDEDGLTLVDTGIPGKEKQIFQAVAELGRSPADIKQILITHLHRDHTGSLAVVKKISGAPAAAHAADAALIRRGVFARDTLPAPGLVGALVSRAMKSGKNTPLAAGVEVEQEIVDGQVIPGTGGLRAVATPGHTADHLVFLWPRQGGVLFAGDVLSRLFVGVRHSPIYENYLDARNSLKILAGLEYDTICFSHGYPIVGGASAALQPKIIKWMDELI